LAEELCEMIFLVPLQNGEKSDNSWNKLPEKRLFHDFMHVIHKVANATTDSTQTMWTGQNFIQVFFDEYIRIGTRDSPPNAEAIAWVTQPSRHSRFLGIARSVRNPATQTTTNPYPHWIAKTINSAMDWFHKGQRKRGPTRRRNQARTPATRDDQEQQDNSMWLNQMQVLPNVQFHPTNQPNPGQAINDTANNGTNENQVNYDDDSDSGVPVHLDDDDEPPAGAAYQTREELQQPENQAATSNQTNQEVESPSNNNTEPSWLSNTLRTPHNHQSNRSQARRTPIQESIRQAGRLIVAAPTEQELSLEIARNITFSSNMRVVVKRPKIEEPKDVPSWCPFFQKMMKKNYFAKMMNPIGWTDRFGKNRSALDVLICRIVLSEMFTQLTNSNRSLQEVKRSMLQPHILEKFCKFPFSIYTTDVMATLDSIFEDRQTCKDKFKSVVKWLKFGNTDIQVTSCDDIIDMENHANQYIVSAALRSMDKNIINDAVFAKKHVNPEVFNKAVIPIPDNNLSRGMMELNDDIIRAGETDLLQSWYLATKAIAKGKITYVVTRRIFMEFKSYAETRNNYMQASKLAADQRAGLEFASKFENYLIERGYQRDWTTSTRKRKRD